MNEVASKYKQAVSELVHSENKQVLEKVSDRAVEQLTQEIVNALRIFVTGENFSGLTIRMIAMRLMHLECQVYVVGATITPTIMRAGDLLIACCESGSSSNVCAIALHR